MARTDQQRFDEAWTYLNGVSQPLANDVRSKIGTARVVEAGRESSLEGLGYWHSGSDTQHKAVRALILCQKAYLTKPFYAGQPIPFQPDTTKRFWHGKSEGAVRDAILSYIPKPGASLPGLVTAAKEANELSNMRNFFTMDRHSKNLGANFPVCFDAVRLWLFKAGFVSLAWFVSRGFDLTANTANHMLGDGQTVSEDELDDIPAGHMFNFHAANDKTVCHWGLSLGNGLGIAANTTPAELNVEPVAFVTGGSTYGTFPLKDSYHVCEAKYRAAVTIRDIDPSLVTTYF